MQGPNACRRTPRNIRRRLGVKAVRRGRTAPVRARAAGTYPRGVEAVSPPQPRRMPETRLQSSEFYSFGVGRSPVRAAPAMASGSGIGHQGERRLRVDPSRSANRQQTAGWVDSGHSQAPARATRLRPFQVLQRNRPGAPERTFMQTCLVRRWVDTGHSEAAGTKIKACRAARGCQRCPHRRSRSPHASRQTRPPRPGAMPSRAPRRQQRTAQEMFAPGWARHSVR